MADASHEQRRAVLEQRVAEIRRELIEHGAEPETDELRFDDDAGFADRSHSTEERSRVLGLVAGLRGELDEVERALEKIETGTYGICERCGRPIGEERLDAIPWATLCIDCKRREGR